MVLPMFLRLVLSIQDMIDMHLDSCPLSDTWYGVILWVFEFGVRAPKQSVRESNFRAERLCSLRRTEEQQKWGNSCLLLRPRSVFAYSESCWCLAKLIFTYYDQLCRIQCVYPGHLTKVLLRTVGNYEFRSAQSGIWASCQNAGQRCKQKDFVILSAFRTVYHVHRPFLLFLLFC